MNKIACMNPGKVCKQDLYKPHAVDFYVQFSIPIPFDPCSWALGCMDATGWASSLLLGINKLSSSHFIGGRVPLLSLKQLLLRIGIQCLRAPECHLKSVPLIPLRLNYTALIHSFQGILAAVYIP